MSSKLSVGKLQHYFNANLIDKVFKILPLYEEENEGLSIYISSLCTDIRGLDEDVPDDLDGYVSLVSIISELKNEVKLEDNQPKIKREVFSAINLVKEINESLGG